jgi:AMP deaminase
MIDNIFEPLFEVTIDPSKDPILYKFLIQLVGFDTVDDESIFENAPDFRTLPTAWVKTKNPHYSYWCYYLYANINSLNRLRQYRGLNTF